MEGQPIKRLSQTEQEERRHLGLCYNCDEKFTRGHNRVCKRLFYVEGVQEEDTDATPEETDETSPTESPCYSLHAVAGVRIANTLHIRVSLGGLALTALLDSGSSHNFIAESAALQTGLPIQRHPGLTATVANGERVPCLGVLRQATFAV
jgi:hypothetical protein